MKTSRHSPPSRVLLALASFASVAGVIAFASHSEKSSANTAHREPPAPLFDNLGGFSKRVSTSDPLAQRYFNQGMMFVFGFNHKEAIRSFEAAAAIDPNLAMAWWGASFAYGPNINAPMEGEAVPPAIAALRKAQALLEHASPWERAYIEALSARYSDDPEKERATLDAAYADAMAKVAKQYPEDNDAAVLRADAVMNTMAWDYWLADRKTPKPATREVIATLERVLERQPDHPGANHALIHLVEAGPEPRRGLASADALKHYAPDAGHLVHMPSHIYMRTGLYHEAVLANERAAAADLAYIANCRAQGFYPGLYYPHNEHFLWWAFTFEGRRADANAKADEIIKLATSPMCGTPVLEKPRFTHLKLLTAVRFADWEQVLESEAPPAGEALDQVMWHWARATAFSARGDAGQAEAEAEAATRAAGSEGVKALDNPYLPAIQIAGIAAKLAEGRAAAARGDTEAALASYRAAVADEDAMPYMEPAFWFYPTRHTLGAALIAAERYAEAEEVFRADLTFWPDNAWSLHGLRVALEHQGKTAEMRETDEKFVAAWQYADIKPRLEMF